ncbi:hypothetical protein [Snodgrassella gandavensis]|nr:hypothetical protein [Snodgrassella gandavensis]
MSEIISEFYRDASFVVVKSLAKLYPLKCLHYNSAVATLLAQVNQVGWM